MIWQVNYSIWHTTKPLLEEGHIWWGYKIFDIYNTKKVFCMEYPHPFCHLCVHTHINILMQAHMTISGACMVWFKLIVLSVSCAVNGFLMAQNQLCSIYTTIKH